MRIHNYMSEIRVACGVSECKNPVGDKIMRKCAVLQPQPQNR